MMGPAGAGGTNAATAGVDRSGSGPRAADARSVARAAAASDEVRRRSVAITRARRRAEFSAPACRRPASCCAEQGAASAASSSARSSEADRITWRRPEVDGPELEEVAPILTA